MPVECLVPWEDYDCQHSLYSLEHCIYDRGPFSISSEKLGKLLSVPVEVGYTEQCAAKLVSEIYATCICVPGPEPRWAGL